MARGHVHSPDGSNERLLRKMMGPAPLEVEESESCVLGVAGVQFERARRLEARPDRRVLFVSHGCYLETSNGASVASRAMMECVARHGLAAATVSGTVLDSGRDADFSAWIAEQGFPFEAVAVPTGSADTTCPTMECAASYRLSIKDVAVVLHKCPTSRPHEPDEPEQHSFLRALERTMVRFRPDVVVSYGGDALAVRVRHQAQAVGAAVVCPLHHFNYRSPVPFSDADAVIVPSRFAASYYRRLLGLECTVLPNLIDFERVRVARRDPRYVTFVNPSHEQGVYVFAKIADELGRQRPDIPLLAVEARGTERTLVDCGIDLRAHRNLFVMSHTSDPRHFWGVTRLCVMPSLWWENQPLVAIEAMVNGIPVIGSDRGGIPEALGDAGLVLTLPSRLNPATRELPTAREVEPWVKAIVALWDDTVWYAEQSRRATAESRRWAPEVLEPQYVELFQSLRPSAKRLSGTISL
jgi:glycosyltransferase involved in cell wall biosynthesis